MTRPEAARPTLAIASNNAGKIAELRALVGDAIRLLTLSDLGLDSPEETGSTFEENAVLKARYLHQETGLPALADDSGLEVDALDGEPGVHSARYAGEPSDDAANRSRLLASMRDVPATERAARFVSVIAIVDRDGVVRTTRGTCDGSVAYTERGSGGFGYDSIFELPDGRTMAELPAAEKNRISHRAVAMRLALASIRQAVESLDEPDSAGVP